jgi:hypothetical protein
MKREEKEELDLKKEDIYLKDEEMRLKLDEENVIKKKKRYESWIIFLTMLLSTIIIELIINKKLILKAFRKYDEMHKEMLKNLLLLVGKLNFELIKDIPIVRNIHKMELQPMLVNIEEVFISMIKSIEKSLIRLDEYKDKLNYEVDRVVLLFQMEEFDNITLQDFRKIILYALYIFTVIVVENSLRISLMLLFMIDSHLYKLGECIIKFIFFKYIILDIITIMLLSYWLYKKLTIIGDNHKKKLKLYKIIFRVLLNIVLFYIIIIIML